MSLIEALRFQNHVRDLARTDPLRAWEAANTALLAMPTGPGVLRAATRQRLAGLLEELSRRIEQAHPELLDRQVESGPVLRVGLDRAREREAHLRARAEQGAAPATAPCGDAPERRPDTLEQLGVGRRGPEAGRPARRGARVG